MAIVDREYLAKAAEEVIHVMEVALKQAKVYPIHHPAVYGVVLNLVHAVERLTGARRVVSFHIAQKEVFLDEIPLTRTTLTCTEFTRLCASKLIGTLTFRAGVTVEEMTKLVRLLAQRMPNEAAEPQATLRERLVEEAVEHIEVGALVSLTSLGSLTGLTMPAEQVARSNYELALDTVRRSYQGLLGGRAIDVENVEMMVKGMVRGLLGDSNVYRRLASIKDYHNYTFNHAVNVAILSLLVGANTGLSIDQLSRLGVAALLHDVGKLRVPSRILSKPGKLSLEEREIIRRHPAEGAQILLEQCGHHDIAVTVAFEHHAGCDLSGYPKIAPARRPHLFSSIVQLSDVYDALTSDRSYRRKLTPDAAAAVILSDSGKKFDPALTKLFVQSVGVYPQNSVILLTNGEPAIVCEQNFSDPLRPKVRLLRRDNKLVDLRKTETQVSKCVDAAGPILRSG